jgi:hypothetical protein
MRAKFTAEEFDGWKDNDSGRLFEDVEFHDCSFSSCSVSMTYYPEKRSRVRNVVLKNCSASGCFIGPAIIENSIVEGLDISKRLITTGAVFKCVVLKGPIGRLIIGQVIPPTEIYEENRQKIVGWFEQANAEYYKTVDWALDISEAEFSDFNVRGIPSRLIRRDPFTQVVVKRDKVMDGRWKTVDLSGTWWHVGLEMLEKSNWEDHTLVAPKRHPQFSQALRGLYRLREAGIAEPD